MIQRTVVGLALVCALSAAASLMLGHEDLAVLALVAMSVVTSSASLLLIRNVGNQVSTARRAIAAVFERLRHMQAASAGGADPSEPEPATKTAPRKQAPPRSEVADLVATTEARTRHRGRIIHILGPTGSSEPDLRGLTVVRAAAGELERQPHALFSAVLVDAEGLSHLTAPEIDWMARCFRWQQDTRVVIGRTGDMSLAQLGSALDRLRTRPDLRVAIGPLGPSGRDVTLLSAPGNRSTDGHDIDQ